MFEKSVRRLYSLMEKVWEKKYKLDRIKKALSYVYGNKEPFNTILVAGTKGKGTVATLIYRGLIENDVRAGLFTSPHVISIRERFQKDGSFISKDDFSSLVSEVFPIVEKFDLTFFETVTLMAAIYFKDFEWVVFEAGLGGRLDATNVLNPEISVITRIGLDHTSILGETYEEIAIEKGGIIREKKLCFCGEQREDVKNTLFDIAEKKGSFFKYVPSKKDELQVNNFAFYENFSLAQEVVRYILKKDVKIKNRYLPFRCDLVNDEPLIILDVAHNPDSFENLSRFVKNNKKNEKTVLVMVLMRDKLIDKIFNTLDWVDELILTSLCNKRARDVYEFPYLNKDMIRESDIFKAMDLALSVKDRNIVFAGSMYIMEIVVDQLERKGFLSRRLRRYLKKLR